MITGQDLIALGYEPAKWFREVLAHANQQQLSGDGLRAYVESVRPRPLLPHAAPVPFHENIRAETAEDQVNVDAVRAAMRALLTTPTLLGGAVMPDACPTGPGQIPVGGVVVARNAIHPALHSADICCSVMLTNFGLTPPKAVLDAGHAVTHFGGGGRAEFSTLPPALEKELRANYFLRSDRSLSLARTHLGTQGDGNHFLFVGQSRQTGETMLITHHGSRGLGAHLYAQGVQLAEVFRREVSPRTDPKNAWLPFDTREGQDYWQALQLVREWTKLNHATLHDAVAQRIGRDPRHRFWNEHNFVFREDDLFYHAKGATPLAGKFVPDAADDLRLVPLNMREPVLIVRGEATATNLGFAPHGAGRNTSRSQHKRAHAHLTAEQLFAQETAGLDVRFFSNHIDISELPSAYKNAAQVQRQMREFNLGEVVDEVLPYGCLMAGDWEQDAPWRQKWKNKQPAR